MDTKNNSIIMLKNIIIEPGIIERIKGRNDIKPDLALALGLVRGSINRLLNDNEPNGKLTTVSALDIICTKLNLTYSEVLTEKQPETCQA